MKRKWPPGPWLVEPLTLGTKYYGTIVRVGQGAVEVWTSNPGKASEREIANGWEPEQGMDHVETDTDLAIARLIAVAPAMADALERLCVVLHNCEVKGVELSQEDDAAWANATALLSRLEDK